MPATATYTDRRLAGTLLILVPIVFTACFTLLQMQFEYPDILRQPTADILAKFQAGGTSLVVVWYVLTLSAVFLIPIALLLHRILAAHDDSTTLRVATAFGIIAGVAQTLGFLRWPFLVPHLTSTYFAPETSEAQRAATVVVFESFHRYAGMAVGEHLGYLSTSLWTIGIALLMWRSPQFGRLFGLTGVAFALGIATGLLEPAGVTFVGPINAISYIAWALWLIAVGIRLVLRPASAPASAPVANTLPNAIV